MIMDGQVPGVKLELLDHVVKSEPFNYEIQEPMKEELPVAEFEPFNERPMIIDDHDQVPVKNELIEQDDEFDPSELLKLEQFRIPDPEQNIRQSENGRFWQCLLCFEAKSCQTSILRHVETHYSCDRCGKCWAGRNTRKFLKRHLKVCERPKPTRKSTICPNCGSDKKRHN
jgi:hypothetical protein